MMNTLGFNREEYPSVDSYYDLLLLWYIW